MFLLDTNVVSELRKLTSGNPSVRRWARDRDCETFWLSAMTVMELEIGVLRLERRDWRQATRIRRWLDDQVLVEYEPRILPIDTAVARRAAALHVPDPRPERDALIGATALVHGLTVVTRNTGNFESMGVAVFNPWLEADA
ncbi:MAG: PIN domain-containing protein [Rhizobiales bacterium]|nr:PIN domain-containing protein [Hyphomicrobiales bacterium]